MRSNFAIIFVTMYHQVAGERMAINYFVSILHKSIKIASCNFVKIFRYKAYINPP